MFDVSTVLENRPGSLAEMGEALGRANVNIEGGGAFVAEGKGIAHFLVADGGAARTALESAGIHVAAVSEVVVHRLNQAAPGSSVRSHGAWRQRVNIEVMYSDHDHRLILVVDDAEAARRVCRQMSAAPANPGV